MKRNAIARIVIYCVIIAALIGIMVSGMDLSNLRFDFGIDKGNYISGNGSVSIEDIDNIEIQWVSGAVNVTIKPDGDGCIDFSESGATESCTMVYEVRGRTLIVRYERPAVHIGIATTPDKTLTVTVPASWDCKNIDIEVVSADVDVLLLTADKVDVENVSGKSIIYVQNATDVNVETVSGSSSIICDTANNINCDTVSGECEVYISEGAKIIDFESVSGDLVVAIFKKIGFEAELDSASGKVYADFSTKYSNGRYQYGDCSLKIDAESVSGNLRIREVQYELTDGCQHIYGPGEPMVVPGSGETVYTQRCVICGHTKTEKPT